MGTDIHGFLESRWERRDGSGTWLRECPIEDSRNYRVFAALADVHNGYGFAGVSTHTAIVPISQPRGLPDDRTKGYGEDVDYEFGDHSASWLTLDEIIDWSGWDQELHEMGWTHVNVSWSRPLREACGLFLAWATYAQAKVGDRAGRIVFGFDS